MMRGVVKLMMGRILLCSRASRSIRMYNNNATNNSSHTWYDYYKINYNHDQYAATRDYYNSKALASKSYTPAIKSPYDSTDAEDYGEGGETDGVLDSVECDRIITKGDVVNLHDLLFTDYRDYLIRYNDDRLVKAAQLEGKKHSIKALLGSPKRDYLISNKGDKVFIDDLEGKVHSFQKKGWEQGSIFSACWKENHTL
ncbi:hypothetical protein POM88_047289 [Heracleum sosnowskyi]|uniref:Uncharacterized protein n=1 Tax=Heracleum sosnowskyi TaxID=360622 RepID=A0AAD8LZC9_9APIA|nr:hypothetical protein POM88_047289 [Heracleum sosnowskyi]